MAVKLVKAEIADAELIWKMQLESFKDLLEKYQDYDLSPGNEPLEKVKRRFLMHETHFYFIVNDGKKVGVIRVVDPNPTTGGKRISPIFIMKEHRGKGYAQAAMLEAEKLHGSGNWSLDTILEEKGNCYLYEKMGYRKTGKLWKVNEKMTIVYYEKQ